jgi:hypothetical protein
VIYSGVGPRYGSSIARESRNRAPYATASHARITLPKVAFEARSS